MALPHTVRVKLSSEAAESISLTPVVVQEMPVRDLVEHMLGVTGKDEARIRELLLRGSLVSGASRFRWAGWEQDLESLRPLLATFPDPDPQRPFASAACVKVILRGGRTAIEIPREAVAQKSLFQRRTFWDQLMLVVGEGAIAYAGYSYRERADRYTRPITVAETERIRAASESVKYSTLRDQIRTAAFLAAELHASRT
ncbi:MAG: hypothetical protein P4L56_25495 [Candidatus Sulfopaludibacter sp.]|nr:hypothetical protein [Candidatus Sulfopaludibacter sp.]